MYRRPFRRDRFDPREASGKFRKWTMANLKTEIRNIKSDLGGGNETISLRSWSTWRRSRGSAGQYKIVWPDMTETQPCILIFRISDLRFAIVHFRNS